MNLADVVKRKWESEASDQVANEMSTFLKQINKKLSLVDLTLEDFKREGAYNFDEATADKLIVLYDFSLGHNISRFEKNKIELADRELLAKYLILVTEICVSHFSWDEMEQINKKIEALHIDLNIYEKESLNNVADGLFEKSSDAADATKLKEVEKLFADIYSLKKYPHLTEMDRVSLLLELENKLATVIEEHQAAIHKVNNYRSNFDNQDEDINEILEY
ncbi:hypothetical protein GI482_16960 [Bacillus sp. N3536]|nr:hypothetical protein GI482_16960 [Bacillus sp. N3536]